VDRAKTVFIENLYMRVWVAKNLQLSFWRASKGLVCKKKSPDPRSPIAD
jgi:hypothetical protein